MALVLAGCGSDPEPATSADSTGPVTRTPELDAIGVIGHSGATGANSKGDGKDARDNSWATGTNPAVNSVYLRLLADHPALEGHNWNDAESGSDVDSLMFQAETLLAHDPVPDIVLVNSIDNDIECDGNDEANYGAFRTGIDEVLTYLEEGAPGIKVFFVGQPTDVVEYDDVVSQLPGGIDHLTDDGPCGAFTPAGKRDPKAERYLQRLVDAYADLIDEVCVEHEDCATDAGAMQEMPLSAEDLSDDMNHFSVVGLAKEASVAWETLPADWK